MILFGGGLACCCIIKKPWYEWRCMRRRPAHNESGFPNSKGPEPRDSNGCRISLLCKKMQKRSLFYNSAVWSCLNSTPNVTLTERPTSCKPRRKLSLKDICIMYACSSPCRKKVRQRKCEVMKKVGGMIMYVLGFVRFEWTSLRHLESADLQSNFVSKGNAPNPKRALNLSCEQRSPLCLRMVYHETSFEAQGVFPQNGNSWN